MTCTLGSASCLSALCVGTAAAVLALGLALVACTLLCAYGLGTIRVLALTTGLTSVLTNVSVVVGALLCAYFLIALCVKALAADLALGLTLVRSLGEGDAGDGHLCAYGTVTEKERTGCVTGSTVRSDYKVLALLERSVCLLPEVSRGTLGIVFDTILVVKVVVLAVRTVVDTDDLAVLVKNERLTPAVGECKRLGSEGGSKDDEVVRTKLINVNVDSEVLGKSLIGLIADSNLSKLVGNLYNTRCGSGKCTVGCSKSNSVLAKSINVKALAVYGDRNGSIVGRIEGTVIIGSGNACKDLSIKGEVYISDCCIDLVCGSADYGSLVNVRSKNLSIVSPKKANNVAVGTDYVVVHEATTVAVNGGAAVTVLNNDCIAACGNYKILCEEVGNSNLLAANLDEVSAAGGTNGVSCVNNLAVCAVTALDNHAVCINNSCNAVVAAYAKSNGRCGGVVEYAALYTKLGVSAKLLVFLVLEVKDSALPLVLAEKVLLNLKGKSGKSLENCYLTGSGCLITKLVDCLIGDGVNALSLSIKIIIALNDKANFLVTLVGDGNAEHKIDVVACVDLKLSRNNGNYGGSFNYVVGVLCTALALAVNIVVGVLAGLVVRILRTALALAFNEAVLVLAGEKTLNEVAGSKGEHKHQYNRDDCQDS